MTAMQSYPEPSDHLALLERIAAAVSGTADPSAIFIRILDEIIYVMECEAAWIQLVDPGSNRCVLAAHRGFTARMIGEINSLAAMDAWVKTVLKIEDPYIMDSNDEESNSLFKKCFPRAFISCITVFIKSRGRTTGILGVLSKEPDKFNRNDASLLVTAGALISAAAERVAAKVSDIGRQQNQLITILGEREEFLNALSHELQTPLTALIASAGMLAEELTKDSKNSTTRLMRNIMPSSSTLKERVNELIDLSREHAAGFDIQSAAVDATAIFRKATEQVTPMIKSKKQSLIVDIPSGPIIINADSRRLEQIALNLLSNATKFTPSGGTITFRAREEKNSILVSVKDTGSGIPKGEHDKLFRPYYRIPGDRYRLPGLGLGLSITKQLIELHKGKIWLESVPGEGTTFIFSIPISSGK